MNVRADVRPRVCARKRADGRRTDVRADNPTDPPERRRPRITASRDGDDLCTQMKTC